MRFKPYMLFVTIQISMMCQMLDVIVKVKHENLCHPYILSTTVLSDTYIF